MTFVTAAATAAGCVAGAYALGTLPTASVIGRATGHDPSAEGSGNPGASNVYRLAGARAGVAVFLVDAAKGALATGVGLAAGGRPLGIAAGMAAVVGHVFPVTRRFRGGRGGATAGGFVLTAFPVVGAAAVAGWLAVARLTRTASLASLTVMVGVPIGVAIAGRPGWEVVATVGLSALIGARHAGNVGRLLRGEERELPARDVR
jgi:glycerol-3-phosphate acyltransferase PlsY